MRHVWCKPDLVHTLLTIFAIFQIAALLVIIDVYWRTDSTSQPIPWRFFAGLEFWPVAVALICVLYYNVRCSKTNMKGHNADYLR